MNINFDRIKIKTITLHFYKADEIVLNPSDILDIQMDGLNESIRLLNGVIKKVKVCSDFKIYISDKSPKYKELYNLLASGTQSIDGTYNYIIRVDVSYDGLIPTEMYYLCCDDESGLHSLNKYQKVNIVNKENNECGSYMVVTVKEIDDRK